MQVSGEGGQRRQIESPGAGVEVQTVVSCPIRVFSTAECSLQPGAEILKLIPNPLPLIKPTSHYETDSEKQKSKLIENLETGPAVIFSSSCYIFSSYFRK